MSGTREFKGLDQPEWAIAPGRAGEVCERFIKSVLAAAGKDRLVVGLSGGIDSAVAAGLAVRAVGPEKITGVMMPYATSSAASVTDALAVGETLGMPVQKVEITPMADAFLAGIPENSDADRIRRGNIMARCRMMVLYDQSAAGDALVLGTGNRTEDLLGYTTLHGDNACALNPLGQLYKTEVRLLSAWLELPQQMLTKAPSADLWEGQADEDELGFTYAEVDHLLHHLVDQGLGPRRLAALGFSADLIEKVIFRVQANSFKRNLPPVAEFSGRADPDAGIENQGGEAS
ncbi:MAG: NAD+ synthase [Gemmatimonadales bacterium]|nr:NAD+ synthase [Gemmatimonadales bacterium]